MIKRTCVKLNTHVLRMLSGKGMVRVSKLNEFALEKRNGGRNVG